MTEDILVRAAVFLPGSLHSQMQNLRVQELRDDEVLVRMVATGVCHTDLGYRNRLQHAVVLGHEGAGRVERVGSAVKKVAPGDPVVLSYRFCGDCASCRVGKPSYCQTMFPLNFTGLRPDGTSALTSGKDLVGAHFFGQSSFATRSVAHESNVVKVRADAPLELLGPLGCGVQTGAGAVLNVLRPNPRESMLLTGAGGVGMSSLMAAVVAGCAPIIVVEPNASRRALAKELGAHFTIAPGEEDVVEKVRQYAPGGVLHAVDTSGLAPVISQILTVLGLRGQVALVTATPREAVITVPLLPAVGRGITIRGVIEGDSLADDFIPQLVEYVVQGKFPLHRLVEFYTLDQLDQAMEDQEAGRVIKPIIRFPAA
jgi:aryl-alcohol dehydrogenase